MTSPVSSSSVRLTRRGRIALTLFMMIGLVVTGFTLGRGSSQAAGHHVPVARHTVTVQAGDTLWSVAARVAPHDDPRAIVAEISSLNRLSSAVVQPGEQLVVPTIG
ncbi:MAG TPA: LysM peptidoglycan-binding domain-containing protein [Mycobacteriales bacterium]|jgi:predicted Zn-dependent protease|nr:LysM peptidoglycan-binding domain-containing protein [Mycobacteriales bacterium]